MRRWRGGSWRFPILVLAHFLSGIADCPHCVGRQVLEGIVGVTAVESATRDVLSRVADDYGKIGVQRGKHLFQVVGTAVEVVCVDPEVDRVGYIPGEGGDEFSVRQPHRICGLWRPSTRHQLADYCNNALSLGHGLPPWLGLGPVASCSLPSAC